MPAGTTPEKTTISVRRDTLDQLRELGRYGDSMDAIINRLIQKRLCRKPRDIATRNTSALEAREIETK